MTRPVEKSNSLLKLEQFEQMARAMRGEKHLLEYDPLKLFRQFEHGLSAVQTTEDGLDIVSHATLWPLIDEWYELGGLWTDSNNRGRGLCAMLMAKVLPHRERVMLTTTNPVVWHLSEKLGMKWVLFHDLPNQVHYATCICQPYKIQGCTDQAHCPLKDNECRAYVK